MATTAQPSRAAKRSKLEGCHVADVVDAADAHAAATLSAVTQSR
jgi:hypothetical protein